MSDSLITSSEEQIRRYKELLDRRASLDKKKTSLMATLQERKRVLKGHIDACKAAGYDPNTLREDLQHMVEVAKVKNDTFAVEIEAGETMIKPMLAEIKG